MIHLSETLPLTTISIEENYRNTNIYREGTWNIFCNFLLTMKMLFVSGGPCVNIQGRGVCLSPICLYSNWLQIPAQCLLWCRDTGRAGFCRGRWMELNKGNLWIRSKPIEVTYLNRFKNSRVMSYIKGHQSVFVISIVKTIYSSLCRNIILNHKPILLATHWKGGPISIFNCDGN